MRAGARMVIPSSARSDGRGRGAGNSNAPEAALSGVLLLLWAFDCRLGQAGEPVIAISRELLVGDRTEAR
eukprot:6519775-Prorocentrum_lima.AAC.1